MGRRKTISDEDLLATARRVFLEHGHGVAAKVIAKAAGVSEGVLFQRFASKNELFFAAMVPPSLDVAELLRPGTAAGREGMRNLTFAMTAYFRQSLPVLVTLMGHPEFQFEEFAARHPETPLVVLRRQLVEFMVDQQRQGAMGPVHAGAAALTVWSTAMTVAFFELLGAHGGRMDASIVEAAVDCFWRGLEPKA